MSLEKITLERNKSDIKKTALNLMSVEKDL